MVNYSKWKNIEVSDDEDETHPNVDTASLFRWRHEARVQRMDEMDREKAIIKEQLLTNEKKQKELQQKIDTNAGDDEAAAALKEQLKKLADEASSIQAKQSEVLEKERKAPWNIDTICKEGFTKAIINKQEPRIEYEKLTDEERDVQMKQFVKDNEKLMKQYGMLRKFEESKSFLSTHHHLVSEFTANFLVMWCIDLESELKNELMKHVAHQAICLQFIFELSKQLNVDPRSCVPTFFTRIQTAAAEHTDHFDKELKGFIERIEKRVQKIREQAIAQEEEEERKARLGPGGLDPVEVFEELPQELKDCFESRDIKMLQDTIAKMPEEDARHYMKLCVDSGLWLPEGGKTASAEENADSEEGASGGSGAGVSESSEDVAPTSSASNVDSLASGVSDMGLPDEAN